MARVISLCLSLLLLIGIVQSYKHDFAGKAININNIHHEHFARNKDHLKTHLKYLDDNQLEKIGEKETEFLFFNAHDYNKDNRLDGLEMLSSLLHTFSEDHASRDPTGDPDFVGKSEEEINQIRKTEFSHLLDYSSVILDNILASSDSNNDGYLDYIEYSQFQSLERLAEENKHNDDNNIREHGQEQEQLRQEYEQQ